jgi:uncharacterized protein (DUF427 family)
MPRAIFNGAVIAETDRFVEMEGNVYFPEETVRREYLRPSPTVTGCPWKGKAGYHHVVVDGVEARDACWYYADPLPAAAEIKGHVAFWRGVRVER